ncbi:MAG TPA: lysophospholipid acyltransferase family protein [Verrucomicrobiae bacterium]|nr:lysophospholipid acyltransferase family protein [Verrucomicrobiae bacterium]
MSFQPESSASTPHRAGNGGVVVPHRPRWYQWIAAWLVVALIRLVSATLRYRWHDDSAFFNKGADSAAIFAIWHNRLGLSMPAYYGYVRKFSHTAGMAALVSASKDGGFLAAILECFKVQPVRGSSSRRGPQALLELTTWAERGFDLAITPDGPRGPCYRVQEGVMSLAQVTGLPIIPFSCFLRWKLRVRSWDRFQIPLPFSYCEMKLGKPVRVPREATDAQREALRQELENTLRSLSRD